MKKHKGLIITNGILLGVYGLIYLIVGMLSVIRGFSIDNAVGIKWTFEYLFTLFSLTSVTLMAFFISKNKLYVVPVAAFVLFKWGISSISFISYLINSSYSSWLSMPEFLLLTAILVITIIEFVFAKPFFKENGEEEPEEAKQSVSEEEPIEAKKPLSLDDISKAKALLDAGAITNEEFYEIKRRALK